MLSMELTEWTKTSRSKSGTWFCVHFPLCFPGTVALVEPINFLGANHGGRRPE